ncbi:MAG: TIR domain-containing protein [Leptolyngbya sp. SIO3F4]|nr:TIR domain-containing protein [Leptolyngbya sp. SIO3F4]
MSSKESIFISYRLSDSSRGTGRIYERLCRDFQPDSIFKDQASIKGGSSFWNDIEQAISNAQVILVMIGPNWLTAKGAAGVAVSNPKDWVRREIELALKLDKPIIPVFLDGAKMPHPSQLPDSLHALTERNGLDVDITNDLRFGDDMNRLVSRLKELSRASLIFRDNGICPYKGLEFFDWVGDDPNYFFGREKLVGELLERVQTSNFMALVGASGNGKSSVLRAGLLHQLSLGKSIAGSDQWEILITRPDVHPIESLATAFVSDSGSRLDRAKELTEAIELLEKGATGLQRLVQVSEAPRTVLVIDQFEEVFTRCNSTEEREQFFSCLMGALEKTGDKLCLIIAMRADFVGQCLEQDYSKLAKRLSSHMVPILPLTEEELRAAICKPAEQVNLTIEPALITQILSDIKDAPGSLPLLQYSLKELWQRRQESTLLLSTYQELGGINGTLDKRATEIYSSFDDEQQRTVQHIFQQLTQLGEGTEDTRRRVFLDNLISDPLHPTERVRAVIDTLSSKDNRLLVTSEVIGKGETKERRAIVDVAHEALIRHWRLLRQWIETNRDSLRQQRRIEASAETWQEHNHSKGYLLQGFPLKEARRFQKQQSDTFPLSDSAGIFLKKSIRQQQWNYLKIASLVILFAPIFDYSLHQQKVDGYYSKLNGANKDEERASVTFLTQNCRQRKGELTGYLTERTTGQYCRSLAHRTFSRKANLSGANLYSAILDNAILDSANLDSANLYSAYLYSANLYSANLYSAILDSAILHRANLSRANLSRANLSRANLSSAILSEAILSNASLSRANLSNASLSRANLDSADLSSAILRSADLSSAYLDGTSLKSTDLNNTILDSAILAATDLRNAKNLDPNQLTGENAPYICNVALPNYITNIDSNRDCNQLAPVLVGKYNWDKGQAETFVQAIRAHKWEGTIPNP